MWNAFEDFQNTHAGAQLWISLGVDDLSLGPSFPLALRNPKVIAKDDSLDLATVTFDGIDSLEAQRFYYFKPRPEPTARKGDIIHYIGYAGDAVREGNPSLTLNYCYSSHTIHDSSRTRFILHSKPGTIHHKDQNGNPMMAFRAGGESGAPVFKVQTNFELELAGIVSQLCSSGLEGGKSTTYEMSDGDVLITHACFIKDDGSIPVP